MIDIEVLQYYPITTNQMYLQCPGKTSKKIAITTITTSAMGYPKDQETGYHMKEAR